MRMAGSIILAPDVRDTWVSVRVDQIDKSHTGRRGCEISLLNSVFVSVIGSRRSVRSCVWWPLTGRVWVCVFPAGSRGCAVSPNGASSNIFSAHLCPFFPNAPRHLRLRWHHANSKLLATNRMRPLRMCAYVSPCHTCRKYIVVFTEWWGHCCVSTMFNPTVIFLEN